MQLLRMTKTLRALEFYKTVMKMKLDIEHLKKKLTHLISN